MWGARDWIRASSLPAFPITRRLLGSSCLVAAVGSTELDVELNLFSPAHLLILIATPLIAVGLSRWCRGTQCAAISIRYTLAALLAANEVIWYVYDLRVEGFHFPDGLPLELCNVTLWVTVVAACTLNPLAFEIVYFAGLAGSGMALLTPDLGTPDWSYPTIYFYLAHGMAVATVLTLVWGKLAAPRPSSLWKVLGILNAYAGSTRPSPRCGSGWRRGDRPAGQLLIISRIRARACRLHRLLRRPVPRHDHPRLRHGQVFSWVR